jgi:hypothetical protein
MTSYLSGATNPQWLNLGPDIFGMSARKGGNYVGAIWSVSGAATASVIGPASFEFYDFYGNKISADAGNLRIGSSPVYFTTKAGPVALNAGSQSTAVAEGKSLASLNEWWRNPDSKFTNGNNSVHVTTAVTQYAYQMSSPLFSVQPGACYLASAIFRKLKGSLGLLALDGRTGALWGTVGYDATIPDGQTRQVQIRFRAAGDKARVVIGNANLLPEVSEYDLVGTPTIGPCEPGLLTPSTQ